ncbi:MAG: hypothetical protein IT583_03605 [Verrucomicrobia bacterium]|nr:hypothetical protein [Verrucomicrobiota bacterium]
MANDLVINFNCGTRTFTGAINGTNLTMGAGTTNVFAFSRNFASIPLVNLTHYEVNTTLYADDIKLLPAVSLGLFTVTGK